MNSRRDFLASCGKAVTGVALGTILLPVLQACTPTSFPLTPAPVAPNAGADGRYGVDISDLSASNPMKVATGLAGVGGLPVLVTRISDTDFRALSSYCPHAGCEVETTARNGSIPCLCHGSRFGLDGSVQMGPSVEGLHSYDALLDAPNHSLRIKLA
jgi:Rieske Fe-S protein